MSFQVPYMRATLDETLDQLLSDYFSLEFLPRDTRIFTCLPPAND